MNIMFVLLSLIVIGVYQILQWSLAGVIAGAVMISLTMWFAVSLVGGNPTRKKKKGE